MLRLFLVLSCLLWPGLAPAARPLQPLIDATSPGGTLRLAAGIYAGPALIDKPLVLDGGGAATLDGAGQGTVLTVRARGASVRGLRIVGNRIAHTITGITFYGEKGGHIVRDNRFEHNLAHAVLYGSGDPLANEWLGNDWDDYEGFDRDGDGVGDTPYEVYAYADRIWIENPQATFFRKAPAMELLDFLERLAPFASPALILRDAAPRVRRR